MSLLTPRALVSVREGDRSEPALLGAFLLGLALAAVHPAGLVVGGALVSLPARSVRRGLLNGLYLGGTVVLVFAAALLLFGTFGRWAGLGRLTALSVGVGLLLPTLGAGLRGLV